MKEIIQSDLTKALNNGYLPWGAMAKIARKHKVSHQRVNSIALDMDLIKNWEKLNYLDPKYR